MTQVYSILWDLPFMGLDIYYLLERVRAKKLSSEDSGKSLKFMSHNLIQAPKLALFYH